LKEYVMVPVPEDLVPRVEQFLQWNVTQVGGPALPWGEDEYVRFLTSLDQPCRALLVAVAQAAHAALPFSLRDASVAAACSEREVLGIVVELNDSVRRGGGPPFVMLTTADESDGSSQDWPINMPDSIAVMILTAAGVPMEDHGEALS
jgi:hypothetical protein